MVRGEMDYSSRNLAFNGGATYRNFGDLFGGDTTGRQHPSGYKEWAFNTKLKLRFSETSTLSFLTQFVKQNGVPVFHKVVLENFLIYEMAVQQRNLHYLRYKKECNSREVRPMEITASPTTA